MSRFFALEVIALRCSGEDCACGKGPLNMSDDSVLFDEGRALKRSAAFSADYVYSGDELPHGAAGGLDHFIVKNGVECAGTHLIIDLIGADRLDDIDHIEDALRRAVDAANATLLHIHLHHFEPNGGVSGVAVLAESHISIHTWPENGYAALDVFMCGDCNPYKGIPVLKEAFAPGNVQLTEHKRGLVL